VRTIEPSETTVDYEHVAEIFKALGHATRLGILAKAVSGEFCVTDLQEHLDRSQANISQHLAVLRERGLAIPERRGNRVCYRLADERLAQIVKLAVDVTNSVSRGGLSDEGGPQQR